MVEYLHNFPCIQQQVFDYLVGQGKRRPYVGIVHRIDRPVSGVLLVAKKKQALKLLNEQFRNRRVQKTYLAVTEGIPGTASADVQHYLRRTADRKKAIVSDVAAADAAACRLQFRTRTTAPVRQIALLEVQPFQGRYHQIRAQLAAIGHPIVGDAAYGSSQSYLANTIALHAYRLSFTDPLSGERQTIVAPPTPNPLVAELLASGS